MSRLPAKVVFATFMLLALTAGLNADLSPVHPSYPGPKSELDRIYFQGVSTFSPSTPGERVYTGGGITATRVDDFGLGGVLDASTGAPGSTDDQLWSGQTLRITPKYKEAALDFNFGYDLNDGVYRHLVFVSGGPPVPQSVPPFAIMTAPSGSTLTWLLQPPSNPAPWTRSSRQDLNDGRMDHLLTYQITGLSTGQPTWLLFWEDGWIAGSPYPGDGDYNDLVVEVTAIPEPAAILVLAVGGLAMSRRRRVERASPTVVF
jgi:hypothetical protein